MFFLSVYYNTQHQSPPWCSVLYSLLTKTLPLCQTALIIYCLPDSMKQSTKSAIATARQTAMPQVRQGLAGAGEYRRRSWPAGHRVCEDTRRGLGRRIQSRQSASLGLLPPPDSDHIRRYLHPKPHSLETCTTHHSNRIQTNTHQSHAELGIHFANIELCLQVNFSGRRTSWNGWCRISRRAMKMMWLKTSLRRLCRRWSAISTIWLCCFVCRWEFPWGATRDNRLTLICRWSWKRRLDDRVRGARANRRRLRQAWHSVCENRRCQGGSRLRNRFGRIPASWQLKRLWHK